MSSDLDNGLNEVERWTRDDPRHLLTYMLEEGGFYSFWQLVVAAAYEEDEISWRRLEAAAQELSRTADRELLTAFVNQLLDKAETVCEITTEEMLFEKVRSLGFLLLPSSGPRN